MALFDLANASLSSAGLQYIKDRVGFVPYVYDTAYPVMGNYVDNDPVPSGSTIFAESVGGRVPFDPDFSDGVRGSLCVGYGHTYQNEGAMHRGAESLYWQFYDTTGGFNINGTFYKFPISKGDNIATGSTGGNYLDSSSTVQETGVRIRYTGDDSDDENMRFSESLASTLLQQDLVGHVFNVKEVLEDYAGAFPYHADSAQKHFDLMVSLSFQLGKKAFEDSYFIYLYKLVTGSGVTSTSDLNDYNDVAYALMFHGTKAKPSDYPSGEDPVKKQVFNPLLVNGVNVTWENKRIWDSSMIKQRQEDIDYLLGTPNDLQTSSNKIDPITDSQWFQGPNIPADKFPDISQMPGWIDVITSTLPAGTVSNTLNTLIAQGRIDQIPLYYTGDASIYDTEPGDEDYYEEDPFYVKAYSEIWQINNRWYKGAQTFLSARQSTTNGPAISAQGDGSIPPYIFGLDNGSGELQVFMTSTYASADIDGITGVDSTSWDIADGLKLGDKSLNQWVHRAVTRKGNKFTTWENGTKVTEWTSDKVVKRNTRDAKTGGEENKVSLNLSIGRSQQADYFKGYIDGIKITKGESIYTSAFTPSSSAPTIDSTTNLYTGNHNLESAYNAIKKVSTQLDTEFRVNNNGTIDAGPKENLFEGHDVDPLAIIVRDSSGEDPGIIGLNPDALTTQFEAEDWVSGVEYLDSVGSDGDNIDLYERFLTNIPYYDLHGNKLERVSYVSETDVNSIMAPRRAEAFLEEFTRIKKSLSLSLEYYDVKGDFEVGDMIFVYDPEVGFVDTVDKALADGRTEPYETIWQGQYINPEKIRIVGLTYPIEDYYGVYLRKVVSTAPYKVEYTDLTDYMIFEEGNTQLDIGDLGKQIGDDLRFSSQLSGTVTGSKLYKPAKVIDPDDLDSEGIRTTSSFYQDALGTQQGIIFVEWKTPRNQDGTLIQNGMHYEITVEPVNPDLGDAVHYFVQWGNETFTVEGLQKATDYKVGVQAVTTGAASGFVYETITTAVDTGTPNTPDQAVTIATLQGAVQIVHNLGAATDNSGNPVQTVVDFTLPNDLAFLNVYGSTTSGFTVNSQSFLGQIKADASMLRNSVPAVATLKGDSLESSDTMYFRFTAVDNAGNESGASDEQTGNAQLVATENINNAAITEAKIQNLAVTNAKVANAAITNAKISNLIESDNYATGTSGWSIQKSNATYPDGFIEINDALIRGNITADTGNIGGWTIANDKLSAGNLELDGGNTTIKGNYTQGSAGFSLNNDGTVEFNDGTFRGDLVAGTIDIGSNAFQVDSQGRLFMGASTFGNANFSVDANGTMVASGATIAGTLNITAGAVHIG